MLSTDWSKQFLSNNGEMVESSEPIEWKNILDATRAKYSEKPYEFWVPLIGADPIVEECLDDDSYCVEVSPIWETKKDGPILVLVSKSSHRLLSSVMETLSFRVIPSEDA